MSALSFPQGLSAQRCAYCEKHNLRMQEKSSLGAAMCGSCGEQIAGEKQSATKPVDPFVLELFGQLRTGRGGWSAQWSKDGNSILLRNSDLVVKSPQDIRPQKVIDMSFCAPIFRVLAMPCAV